MQYHLCTKISITNHTLSVNNSLTTYEKGLIYEKSRGINALIKLLHGQNRFAINCPALRETHNNKKIELIRS